MALNKAMLIGNLGQNPEVRTLQDGRKMATLSVATSESWRDKKSGERVTKTEWHRVVVWNENIAKFAEQYLKKGSRCYVEGQIETRKFQDRDGQERYTTEIVLRPFNGILTNLSSKDEGGGSSASSSSSSPRDNSSDERSDERPSEPSSNSRSKYDDEIPF